MAQEDGSDNKNASFWERNQSYVISGVIAAVAIVIIIFSWNSGGNRNNENESDNGDVSGEVTENTGNGNAPVENKDQDNGSEQASGNLSVQGTLRVSDNQARGNYMVDSAKGKIYVRTVRDFSDRLDKQVTLHADGTLNSFVFLGFDDQTVSPGAGSQPGGTNVSFTGVLNSSNSGRGNYTVTSGGTVVYLQTVHDYNAWIGSQVELKATGSLDSFTNAVLVKK